MDLSKKRKFLQINRVSQQAHCHNFWRLFAKSQNFIITNTTLKMVPGSNMGFRDLKWTWVEHESFWVRRDLSFGPIAVTFSEIPKIPLDFLEVRTRPFQV